MKNNKLLIGIIIGLVLIIGITAYLNRDNVKAKKELNENAIFIMMDNGNEVKQYDLKTIRTLGETTFKANLKSNGKDPITYEYTGVPLKNVFADAGLSLDGKDAVIVTAADGYSVAIEIGKVLEDDNVYLAYMREGESLGTNEEGGDGPYEVIISKDQFSQYWCKLALSAEAK